jgi:protein SCO1/2
MCIVWSNCKQRSMPRALALILPTLLLASATIQVGQISLRRQIASDGNVTQAPAKRSDTAELKQEPVSVFSVDDIPTVNGTRVSDRFPNIDLIDHRGRRIRFYDDLVRDRTVCIVFFYTRCTGSCPGTTITLKRIRESLRDEFSGDELKFVSLTLEPDIDTPGELREYMNRYGICDDQDLPDWVYATGDFGELDHLRRVLGVYDLDPVIDADKTEHASILTFGNDRTNRWAALPTGMKDCSLLEAIVRIAGNSHRQRYSSAVRLGGKSETVK